MGDKSKIEWTEATWNPVTGCNKVSPGCKNCYAERMAKRLQAMGQKRYRNGFKVTLQDDVLEQPLRWKRPRMIFGNSMGDLFHADVPDEFIDKVFAVMALAPWHTYQILTKRAERMSLYTRDRDRMEAVGHQAMALLEQMGRGTPEQFAIAAGLIHGTEKHLLPGNEHLPQHIVRWPLPQVWLGVSTENQPTADERVPQLLQSRAAVRFLSAEPLLGQIVLRPEWLEIKTEGQYMNCLECGHGLLKWVIVGGESGPNARPMHPEWARSLRDQCARAGVPYFFKQFGEWYPDGMFSSKGHWIAKARTWVKGGTCIDMTGKALKCGVGFDTAVYPVAIVHRIGKKKAGRLLDGCEWDEMPEVQHG